VYVEVSSVWGKPYIYKSEKNMEEEKNKTLTPEMSVIDKSGSGENPQSNERIFFAFEGQGGRKEGWYLTSGGMCQRNSCRVGNRMVGPLGGTDEARGEAVKGTNYHCTTVPKDIDFGLLSYNVYS
jgi:hypothetical protein